MFGRPDNLRAAVALKSVTRIDGMSRQFRSGCKDLRAKKPAGLHRRVLGCSISENSIRGAMVVILVTMAAFGRLLFRRVLFGQVLFGHVLDQVDQFPCATPEAIFGTLVDR